MGHLSKFRTNVDMAIALGKRKRRADAEGSGDGGNGADDDNVRALFQRAFEAKFKPLEKKEKLNEASETDEDSDSGDDGDEDDWDGFSDEEEGGTVEVIQHDGGKNVDDERIRREKKLFMSSKPPSEAKITALAKNALQDATEDDASESANLKYDLALQRLLKESHLLDPSTFSGSTVEPEGKSRLKALDLRLKDLGAKHAISEQERMPIAHRKGIKAKAANREVARRKDAAENGIILEKARAVVGKPHQQQQRRPRGIGAPSVGKFKGGTLKLSSRDVRAIEGPKDRKGAGKKGRRR
jgi:hypothetical protein